MHSMHYCMKLMNFSQRFEEYRITLKGKYMPDYKNKLPQNVAGPYYVDSSCIDCDLCRNTAPAFFRRDDEIGFTVVYRQPITPEDHVLAEQAREGCPTESIGNDGLASATELPSRTSS